ncbi:MAG: PD40 domain-containing protein [Planctomycetes bacterium]|nr:PD40 domain-containing protein [Planctomycetota bacterium]
MATTPGTPTGSTHGSIPFRKSFLMQTLLPFLIAAGTSGAKLVHAQVPEHDPVKVVQAFKIESLVVAVSADGKRIAVNGTDSKPFSSDLVRVIELKSEKVVGDFPVNGAQQFHPAFSPDGKQLVFGSLQATVINAATLKPMRPLQRMSGAGALEKDVFYSPDSKILWSFDQNAVIGYDTKTMRETRTIPVSDSAIVALAFLPKRKMLAVGLKNNSIQLYPVGAKKPVPEIVLPAAPPKSGFPSYGLIRSMAESSDGQFMAVSRQDKDVELWDLDQKQVIRDFPKTEQSQPVLILKGKYLVARGTWPDPDREGGPVTVFDLNTGKEVAYLKAKGYSGINVGFWSMQASPDEKQLFVPCGDGTVQIFDVSEWAGTATD